MISIQYGNAEFKTKENRPAYATLKHFDNWKKDFFNLNGVQDFQIYLHGQYLRYIKYKVRTKDIDILLTGNKQNEEAIEYLLYEGTKLAIEKHGIIVDMFWGSGAYPIHFPEKKGKQIIYLLGNCYIYNGKLKKHYKDAIQLRENLWKIVRYLPNKKMKKQIKENTLLEPERLWNADQWSPRWVNRWAHLAAGAYLPNN